jgi:cell division initiation protein
MRGYSEEQVDVFLDEVADEFERLFQDNIELRERIQLLDERVAAYEDLKETLNNTLVSAQQQADATRANAHKEGELVVRDAELKARGIVGEVYSEKQRVQQSLIQLRQMEEDFRFKFRSLLEAHINLLGDDEASEERRRFRDLGTAVEQESAPSLQELVPSLAEDVPASPTVGKPSDASTETVPAPETAVAADQEVAATDQEAVAQVEVEVEVEADVIDELDLSGYVAKLPDPEIVPPEVVPDDSADRAFAAEASEEEAAGDEAADEEEAGDEAKGSTVRRFLFGKRDKPDSGELFEKKDRDFEW